MKQQCLHEPPIYHSNPALDEPEMEHSSPKYVLGHPQELQAIKACCHELCRSIHLSYLRKKKTAENKGNKESNPVT